jgi:hypothetical protein
MCRRGVTTILLVLCLGVWLDQPAEAGQRRRTLDRVVQDGWTTEWCPLGLEDFLIFEADGPRARLTFSVNGVAGQRLDNVQVVKESALASHLRDDPTCNKSPIYDAAASPPTEAFFELFDFEANGWRLENASLNGGSAPRLPFDDFDTGGGAIHFAPNGRASIEFSGLAAGTRYAVSAWWYAPDAEAEELEIEVDTLDPLALFLGQDGRFEVSATWRTPSATGQAKAVPLTSDTGFFWFFGEANVEVVIKVLDACGLNNRFWVFAGGLTNVRTVITVTDTQTGISNSYINQQGTPFQPLQDTSAVATCP